MLSGQFKNVAQVQEKGFLASFPRFQGDAFEHNLKLVRQVETLAEQKGCTAAQLAIGWVQGQSKHPGLPTIIPIPGATTVSRVEENAKLVSIAEDEFKTIDDMVKNFEVAGGRYPEHLPVET